MNLGGLILFIVLIGLLIWFGFWLKRQAPKQDAAWEKNALRWLGYLVWLVAVILVLNLLQATGVTNFRTPFSGPTVGNSIPAYTAVPAAGEPPKVEVKDGRPNLDEVKAEHRKNLEDFEEKKE